MSREDAEEKAAGIVGMMSDLVGHDYTPEDSLINERDDE